jgi:hypothetical protein
MIVIMKGIRLRTKVSPISSIRILANTLVINNNSNLSISQLPYYTKISLLLIRRASFTPIMTFLNNKYSSRRLSIA